MDSEGNQDELLDFDALEALLDADDVANLADADDVAGLEDADNKLTAATVEEQPEETESLEEFLNAASESEDEEETKSREETGKRPSNSLHNLDAVEESIPHESTKSGVSDEKSKQLGNDTSGNTTSTASPKVTTKSPEKQSGESAVDPATKALQEELEKMRARMKEMENLLIKKTQQDLANDSDKVKNKLASDRKASPKNKNTSSQLHRPSSSKKIFAEQLKKGSVDRDVKGSSQSSLKLMPETESNLFFDGSPSEGKPSSDSKRKEKSDGKHSADSGRRSHSDRDSDGKKKLTHSDKVRGVKGSPEAAKGGKNVSEKNSGSGGETGGRDGGLQHRKKLEKALFGDNSDDSDWEEMDGESNKMLSDQGRELKRIIKSQQSGGSRVAHQSRFGSVSGGSSAMSWSTYYAQEEEQSNRKRKKEPEKRVKNELQCQTSSSDQVSNQNCSAKDEEKSVTDDFSRIRIVNPLISSSLMKSRMDGRRMIAVPKIRLKLKSPEMQGDWVTIGVVVSKSDPKTSSGGKTYTIWRLNDLEDLDNSVGFFLFGEVHKQLWKTEVGSVVGVLNPSIMDSQDKSGSEPAFTVRNPNQVMLMGRSKDLAWCSSRTKSGNKCFKFINRRLGEFCAYHVQAAYRKTSATRLELHGSVTGIKPKSFINKVFSKDAVYHYQGQTFVPNSRSDSGKKKNLSMAKLQGSAGKGHLQKVNTLSLLDIKPEVVVNKGQSSKVQGVGGDAPSDVFLDMIAMPSPGSMNLVAHIKHQSQGSNKNLAKSPLLVGQNMQSVSAKELIKQHRLELKEKKMKQSSSPSQRIPQLGRGLSANQDVLLFDSPRTSSVSAQASKLKAIAAVRKMGGLEREDPNALKKRGEKIQEKVKSRVESDCGMASSSSSDSDQRKQKRKDSGSSSGNSHSDGPSKKKSKLLGGIDLNSDEVKNILKARSKHKGILAEAEAEREEAYFTQLEKKEMMEEKIQSTTSIEITVVTCKMCMYTAQSAKDSCKKENHPLKRSKAKKRFFACKKCKQRTFVIDTKFPTTPCTKCGGMSYEKTSIAPIRSGPKLDSEVLNLRGDEVKYLNSLGGKVYLNTVIDD